jgi:hypothetical protein
VPLASREALFEQAGVITTHALGELVEAAALLAAQPVPAGRTVAIVSNVGSAGLLAADACTDRGLAVYRPHGPVRPRLAALVPEHGAVGGPVDMTATVPGEDFRRCLELLAAADGVHAIIALVLPTGATGDLVAAVQEAEVDVPLLAVVLNQPESVRLLSRSAGGQVPAYGYPEAAVAALARAAGYGAWRAEPRGRVHDFPGIDTAGAHALAREFLGQAPDGGWLPLHQTADLLRCYGIPLVAGDSATANTPPVGGGTDVIVRVTADDTFGPLVVLELAGMYPQTPGTPRLAPLTDTEADELIRGAGLGAGLGGAALRDLLLRVSRLADDLPEVTDLVLRPVVARPDGVVINAARIKMTPCLRQDPFLRGLR